VAFLSDIEEAKFSSLSAAISTSVSVSNMKLSLLTCECLAEQIVSESRPFLVRFNSNESPANYLLPRAGAKEA